MAYFPWQSPASQSFKVLANGTLPVNFNIICHEWRISLGCWVVSINKQVIAAPYIRIWYITDAYHVMDAVIITPNSRAPYPAFRHIPLERVTRIRVILVGIYRGNCPRFPDWTSTSGALAVECPHEKRLASDAAISTPHCPLSIVLLSSVIISL